MGRPVEVVLQGESALGDVLQDRYAPSRLNGCVCGQIGGASSGEGITYKREDSHVLQKNLLRWEACDTG